MQFEFVAKESNTIIITLQKRPQEEVQEYKVSGKLVLEDEEGNVIRVEEEPGKNYNSYDDGTISLKEGETWAITGLGTYLKDNTATVTILNSESLVYLGSYFEYPETAEEYGAQYPKDREHLSIEKDFNVKITGDIKIISVFKEKKEETYKLASTVTLIDPEGQELKRDTLENDQKANDYIMVKGLGNYLKNEKIFVSFLITDENYILKEVSLEYSDALYPKKNLFEESADFSIKEYGYMVDVVSDVFVNIVLQQKEQFHTISTVDEAYWKAQNQRAYNEIYPHIVKLSEAEEDGLFDKWEWGLKTLYPALDEVLHADTLYSGEVNMISYRLGIKVHQSNAGEKNGEGNYQIRMAYALADMNGNIVRIFPPFRQDAWPKCVNYPVFLEDLPEGDYIQKVLIQIPEDPGKWYDLYIHDSLSDSHFPDIKEYIDPSLEWQQYVRGGGVYIKPLPRHLLWYNNKTLTRHVVKRKTEAAPPVPGWTNSHFFDNAGNEIRYGSMGSLYLYAYKNYKINLKLTNKSNAYRKGTVHAVLVHNPWIAQNKEMLDELEKALEHRAPKGNVSNGEVFYEEMGLAEIVFNGEEEKEIAIKIKTRTQDSAYNELPGSDNYIVFYWQPDGSDERFFMNQDFSKVLNRMQDRTDVPFGEWWTGSAKAENNIEYLDGWNNFKPIIGENVLFEEFQIFQDGNGVMIQIIG